LKEMYQKFLQEERKQSHYSGARANSEVQRNVRAAIFSKQSTALTQLQGERNLMGLRY
jgi:hypothetical protein